MQSVSDDDVCKRPFEKTRFDQQRKLNSDWEDVTLGQNQESTTTESRSLKNKQNH